MHVHVYTDTRTSVEKTERRENTQLKLKSKISTKKDERRTARGENQTCTGRVRQNTENRKPANRENGHRSTYRTDSSFGEKTKKKTKTAQKQRQLSTIEVHLPQTIEQARTRTLIVGTADLVPLL